MRISLPTIAFGSLVVGCTLCLFTMSASAQILGPADSTADAKLPEAKPSTDTLVAQAADTSTKPIAAPAPEVTWGNCLGTTMDILRGTQRMQSPFKRLE